MGKSDDQDAKWIDDLSGLCQNKKQQKWYSVR